MTDNEQRYLNLIEAVSEYSCPNSDLNLRKGSNDNFIVTIKPSEQNFRQDIIHNILAIHRLLKIPIIFSSSLKVSNSVAYNVKLENPPA